jgi:hypothetical protein
MRHEKVNPRIETIADLVAMTIEDSGTKRYLLRSDVVDVWNDDTAGKEWDAKKNVLNEKYFSKLWNLEWSDPQREAFRVENDALDELRPATHKVTTWYLEDAHYYDHIDLSDEIGKAMNKIWTKSPSWRGSDRMVNKARLTLKGICAKLGQSDIGKQIKDAQAEEQRNSERNNRNYLRSRIRNHATQLQEIIQLAKKDGIKLKNDERMENWEYTVDTGLNFLANLKDEA